jgi:hypothetical protein
MMKIAIARAVGAAVATAVLAGSALVGPLGATAAQAADRAGTEEPTACQQLWDSFPTALQDDIRAAVQLPLRERRRALAAIRYGALHGTYGDQAQQWAEKVKQRRIEIWKKLPDRMRADILAARSLPLREQRRAMLTIRHAALQGVYGEWVQSLAERRREFRQGCPDVLRPYVGDGQTAQLPHGFAAW